jgi:hypothetical protein
MDELEKSIPAAEGMVEAETQSEKPTPNEFCLNCGTKLLDKFCHHCGQKDIPKRQTLVELWVNFISSFWSYEGKFFRTTQYIITRPGFLAIEYNQGKRESYFHPARMYVFISFVFFLLFFSLPDSEEDKNGESTITAKDSLELNNSFREANKQLRKAGLDTLAVSGNTIHDSVKTIAKKKVGNKNVGFSITDSEFKTKEAYDSAELTKSEDKRDGWFMRRLHYKAIEINKRYDNDTSKFGEDFKQSFNDNFSKVLFWLLPVFALLLKLLYIRKDYFFSEHLVFSIYCYNFFYLAASLQMLIALMPWLDWLATLIGFWIFFYLLFAMKRMYDQRWGKTILKFSIFVFLFSIMMGIGFSISAMAILFFI